MRTTGASTSACPTTCLHLRIGTTPAKIYGVKLLACAARGRLFEDGRHSTQWKTGATSTFPCKTQVIRRRPETLAFRNTCQTWGNFDVHVAPALKIHGVANNAATSFKATHRAETPQLMQSKKRAPVRSRLRKVREQQFLFQLAFPHICPLSAAAVVAAILGAIEPWATRKQRL